MFKGWGVKSYFDAQNQSYVFQRFVVFSEQGSHSAVHFTVWVSIYGEVKGF